MSRALADRGIVERIIHTGQHYDASMSDVFFQEMGIPAPAHHLGVGSASHGQQTALMLQGIERILLEEGADWLLVYGDTNSTLAGALAAAKLHVPIAHVEAGLRSFNRRMPEEVNRIVTDHVASLLLCPTETAVVNLKAEGIADSAKQHRVDRRVRLVGDVMFDAMRFFGQGAAATSKILDRLRIDAGQYDLVTIHRAENTDDQERLQTVLEAIESIAQTRRVVWPVHPRTRTALGTTGAGDRLAKAGVVLCDPVGYLDMLVLESRARCVITDSGGVQKEAYFARVPCVTLREETEWVELLAMGWNQLAPPSGGAARIVQAVLSASEGESVGAPFGTGNAAQLIAEAMDRGH